MSPFDTMPQSSPSPFAMGQPGGGWASAPPLGPSPFETSRGPPSASSLPPGALGSVGSVGALAPPSGQQLGQNLTIVVTRLLDMPIEATVVGGTKSYRIVVYDDNDQEIGRSPLIESSHAAGADMETLSIHHNQGTMHIRATTQLIFVEVEHVGGFLGHGLIGRCQIHRQDPRSSQVWPYALSDKDGNPANCGVELKVAEEGGAPLPDSLSPMGSGARLSHGPPRSSSRQGGKKKRSKSPATVGSDISHGVSALIELDKVTDMPYPRNERLREVFIAVCASEQDRELRRVGPFPAVDQGTSRKLGRLARADCASAPVVVNAPLHFGGDAEGGAMYIRISVNYGDPMPGSTEHEFVGITEAIKVSWVPSSMQYCLLKGFDGSTLGGVYLRCRLLTEAEATAHAQGAPMGAAAGPGRRVPQIGAPVEPLHRVSGRTGNFPAGSPEEAYEQAAINAEAQNRALLQRCKIADPSHQDKNPHVKLLHGYREWDSLDCVFLTMGPNPLAMSEDIGPSVCRSYQDNHTLLKELRGNLPEPKSQADAELNLRMLRMMHHDDPHRVTTALRPVICKDPDEIAASKDMSWCPDPPIYAPMRNMHDEDRETLRLACYAPEQDAKLCFMDANPNYRISEDVWGVMDHYKAARSRMVPKPVRPRRVKDECIMA